MFADGIIGPFVFVVGNEARIDEDFIKVAVPGLASADLNEL